MNPLVQVVLAWWLIATLVMITVVDTIALIVGNGESTVSAYVYQLGRDHPVLYLVIGITIGHLILPLVVVGANGHAK